MAQITGGISAAIGRVAVVDVRLLGPLRVLDRGGVEIDIPGARPRALIALLALEAPNVVSTDRIMDALWDDDDTPSKSALHVAVSRIRTAVGEAARQRRLDYGYGIPGVQLDRVPQFAAIEVTQWRAPNRRWRWPASHLRLYRSRDRAVHLQRQRRWWKLRRRHRCIQ